MSRATHPKQIRQQKLCINHGKKFPAEYWFELFVMFDNNSWTKHAWDTQFAPESALYIPLSELGTYWLTMYMI